MKITLDHNCIIHLKDQTDIGKAIEVILSDKKNNCFVVNVGASEMRERGVRPDHYEKFEELLVAAGIAHLPRLNPMMRLDVTFLGRSGLADDETIKLADAIEEALFGGAHKIAIASVGLDSPAGKTWLNRQCDVHGMWCHIRNGNEVFLTTDGNFKKQTKEELKTV